MTLDDEKAVIVKNLHKTFRLPHEQHSGIKQHIINTLKGVKGYETQKVLNGISFEIKKGEFFGIVGRNGSGKSTLLKLIAGIYVPDSGLIQINGSLTPFIELGVGFNPELTGRENIFLNGALLGFSRSEIDTMYDEIVEFTELEKFMDQKLKNYSSGMQVRLAFSIAIRARSDILLLDEVLAVGDEAFQRKCFEYFAQLKREKKTVILVTHDMNSIQRFCTKAMLLNKGKIEIIGNTGEVTSRYEELNVRKNTNSNTEKNNKITSSKIDIKVRTMNSNRRETDQFSLGDRIMIHTIIKPKKNIKDAFVGFTIQKPDGEYVYWVTTEDSEYAIKEFKVGKPIEIFLELQNIFGENSYSVNVSVKSNDRTREYLIEDNAALFYVTGMGRNGWMLHPEYSLTIGSSKK